MKCIKVFSITAIIMLFWSCSGSNNADLKSVAFSQAKEYLKNQVNDPSSFDGGHIPDSVVPLDDSTFIVNSTFTENKNATKISTKYNITMHYKGGDPYQTGSWNVEELIIDDKKIK